MVTKINLSITNEQTKTLQTSTHTYTKTGLDINQVRFLYIQYFDYASGVSSAEASSAEASSVAAASAAFAASSAFLASSSAAFLA